MGKLEMNKDFLNAIKDSAIDCKLNQCNSTSCYSFDNKDGLAYLPYINEDIAYNFRKSQKNYIICGISDKNKIVLRKDSKWTNINNKTIKKPKVILKVAIDPEEKKIFDYDKMINEKSMVIIGNFDEKGNVKL